MQVDKAKSKAAHKKRMSAVPTNKETKVDTSKITVQY